MASSRIQIIQNLEGGIIKDIVVKPGDQVSSGDPLVYLETTLYQSELVARQKEKLAAERNLELIEEERDILAPLVERMEMIRLLQRLSEAETQLLKLEQSLPILEDRLNRSTVKASIEGVVNRLLVNTTGGVVQPGEALLEIVSSLVPPAPAAPANI